MWCKYSKKKYYHASPFKYKPGERLVPSAMNPEWIFLTNSPKPHYSVAPAAVRENWYIYEWSRLIQKDYFLDFVGMSGLQIEGWWLKNY